MNVTKVKSRPQEKSASEQHIVDLMCSGERQLGSLRGLKLLHVLEG